MDDIPSDTPVDSKIRKMFRETMASIRGLLPEPLCYFEDTGLIIIAFVIISALLHLTNMLFSKSVGKSFDKFRWGIRLRAKGRNFRGGSATGGAGLKKSNLPNRVQP